MQKMKKWKLPPIIKIYEALGAIADKRVKMNDNQATVTSSSGNKYYMVQYLPNKQAITANDNGSYWQGYLGYPSIAFLMKKGVISYDKELVLLLADIPWKDLNQKYKNDFAKVENYIKDLIEEKEREKLENEIQNSMSAIKKLNFSKLASQAKPPKGY